MVALTLMVRSKWDQWVFQWNCVGVTTTPKGAQVELRDLSVLVWVLPEHQRLKTEFLVAWEWEETGREWKVTRWWEALKRVGQRGAPTHPPCSGKSLLPRWKRKLVVMMCSGCHCAIREAIYGSLID